MHRSYFFLQANQSKHINEEGKIQASLIQKIPEKKHWSTKTEASKSTKPYIFKASSTNTRKQHLLSDFRQQKQAVIQLKNVQPHDSSTKNPLNLFST